MRSGDPHGYRHCLMCDVIQWLTRRVLLKHPPQVTHRTRLYLMGWTPLLFLTVEQQIDEIFAFAESFRR